MKALEIIALREMNEGDLPQVLEIEEQTFTSPFDRATFLSLLLHPHVENWVALAHEEVLGYIDFQLIKPEVDLLNIAVMGEQRGRGVGSLLLDKLLERGRLRGVEKVYLAVRPSNEVARRFYNKYGFKEVGIRKKYYTDTGEDGLVYMLELR